jgi:hypothetical protein
VYLCTVGVVGWLLVCLSFCSIFTYLSNSFDADFYCFKSENQRTAAIKVLKKVVVPLREFVPLMRRYVLRMLHLLVKALSIYKNSSSLCQVWN